MRAVHKPNQMIKNIRGTPPSYDTQTRHEDGAWQTYVLVRCARCQQRTDVHWNTGGAEPAFVDKKLRGMGWHFDAYKPKNCICPKCIIGKVRGLGLEPTEEELAMVKSNAYAGIREVDQSGYRPPQGGDTALVQMVGKTDAPVPRKLTAHERTKVRNLLDGHFDELKGRYLDGYDDKKVGIECDVPWALVTEIRELAYGPIKDDPEVVAFKAEAKALREEFVSMAKNAYDAIEKLQKQCERIEGRLINIEAKAKKL